MMSKHRFRRALLSGKSSCFFQILIDICLVRKYSLLEVNLASGLMGIIVGNKSIKPLK